jgi:glycine dehydrogenase subunit 1
MESLLEQVPQSVRLTRELSLPRALCEHELLEHMTRLSGLNAHTGEYAYFLGGGAYDHIIPSVVKHLTSRAEFYTPYTPYQPELSQGTLQAIYEYQTLICQLTDMDTANASMYDGASAMAEAALMAARVNGRRGIVISRAVHPEYRQVLRTYLAHYDMNIQEAGLTPQGTTDIEAVRGAVSGDTAAVIVQSPNFLGAVEEMQGFAAAAHDAGALLVSVVVEPISLGILTPPGSAGADIVVGEGQPLGNDLNYGGPYLGFFATLNDYLRSMPGRLVGRTVDASGKPGFVLTLATREQHIRRDRATSNICTNEALCALNAAVFMCSLGRKGLRELALLNLRKTAYAKETFASVKGCSLPFGAPTFNEFVLRLPAGAEEVNRKLEKEKIIGGLDVSGDYPELGDAMLICVTEKNSREEIDRFARVLETF